MLSVTINIIINNTFKGVIASLIGGVVVPPFNILLKNVSFSSFFVPLDARRIRSLTRTGTTKVPIVTCKTFLGAMLRFLVVTFTVFVIVGRLGHFLPGPRPTPRPQLYPFYHRPVTSSTAHYPRYADRLPTAVSRGWPGR